MAVIEPKNLAKYLNKKMKAAESDTLKKWKILAKPVIKQAIQQKIGSGLSPVEGKGAFEPYSTSYKKQISGSIGRKYGKKLKPVNLSLSGLLRKSLKVKSITAGISVYFSDKKAKWHNNPDSSSSMPRRAILPLTGESFNKKIIAKLNKLYTKLFKIS